MVQKASDTFNYVQIGWLAGVGQDRGNHTRSRAQRPLPAEERPHRDRPGSGQRTYCWRGEEGSASSVKPTSARSGTRQGPGQISVGAVFCFFARLVIGDLVGFVLDPLYVRNQRSYEKQSIRSPSFPPQGEHTTNSPTQNAYS